MYGCSRQVGLTHISRPGTLVFLNVYDCRPGVYLYVAGIYGCWCIERYVWVFNGYIYICGYTCVYCTKEACLLCISWGGGWLSRKSQGSSSFHRLDMTLAVAEALNPNNPPPPKKKKQPQNELYSKFIFYCNTIVSPYMINLLAPSQCPPPKRGPMVCKL